MGQAPKDAYSKPSERVITYMFAGGAGVATAESSQEKRNGMVPPPIILVLNSLAGAICMCQKESLQMRLQS